MQSNEWKRYTWHSLQWSLSHFPVLLPSNRWLWCRRCLGVSFVSSSKAKSYPLQWFQIFHVHGTAASGAWMLIKLSFVCYNLLLSRTTPKKDSEMWWRSHVHTEVVFDSMASWIMWRIQNSRTSCLLHHATNSIINSWYTHHRLIAGMEECKARSPQWFFCKSRLRIPLFLGEEPGLWNIVHVASILGFFELAYFRSVRKPFPVLGWILCWTSYVLGSVTCMT